MQPTTENAVPTRLRWLVGSLAERPVAVMLYYLAVLLGLALLYGGGEVMTSGFIYQAF
ncbi:teichoic acid D-Ala incorporation-associated protein DltX [Candidatus Binatia bacterium]|nr:teichoic acid D-Ala incorporation-associated protein DltX [Candidatus Binatia bacterium]